MSIYDRRRFCLIHGVSRLVEVLGVEGGIDESWEREEEACDIYIDVVSDECSEICSDWWRCLPKLLTGFSGRFSMISKGGMCWETPLTIIKAKACQNEDVCLRMGYLNVPSTCLALSLSNIQLRNT